MTASQGKPCAMLLRSKPMFFRRIVDQFILLSHIERYPDTCNFPYKRTDAFDSLLYGDFDTVMKVMRFSQLLGNAGISEQSFSNLVRERFHIEGTL